MTKIIPLIFAMIGMLAGGGTAFMLKSSASAKGDLEKKTHVAHNSDEHAEKKDIKAHSKKAEKKSHNKSRDDKKHHAQKDKHKKSKKDHDKENNKSHGGDKAEHGKKGSNGSYMKFSRQFVVPVIDSGAVKSLVILDLNLAVDPAGSGDTYSHEPKVRDALMTSLLDLADRGLFSGDIGAERNTSYIRNQLKEAAQGALGQDVEDVLILDMMRQDL